MLTQSLSAVRLSNSSPAFTLSKIEGLEMTEPDMVLGQGLLLR